MTSAQASRVVLLSGAGMATYVLVLSSRGRYTRERTYRSLWAIGLLTLGLAVFADFLPELAGPFALLILIAMSIRNTGVLGTVLRGPTADVRVAPRTQGGTQ